MKKQKGVTMVEYLVVASAMAIALWMPVPLAGANGRSATQWLIDSIIENHHAYLWGMSMPL